MAQQTVSIGSSSNDGTGDPLRTAFTKVNENFSELYQKTGVDTSMTLQLSGNSLISTTTNTDIIIDPNLKHFGRGKDRGNAYEIYENWMKE